MYDTQCLNSAEPTLVLGDVKELVPEFFYLPDFLRNVNHYNFGTKQDDKCPVDDVLLPPWANSPEVSARQHTFHTQTNF